MPLSRGQKVRLGEYGLKWVDFKYERLPIFSYLCGRINHDERDCLQGFRSKETLRLEEKQFGPWLRATQDKHQKPLIVIAARNEANRIKEARTGLEEHRTDGNVERTTVSDNPGNDLPGKAERMVGARANVIDVNTLSSHIQVKIPKIPLISNFEQQLWDIDAAISGEVSDVNTKPRKEVNLEREEISLNQNDASLDV